MVMVAATLSLVDENEKDREKCQLTPGRWRRRVYVFSARK